MTNFDKRDLMINLYEMAKSLNMTEVAEKLNERIINITAEIMFGNY